MTQLMDRYGIPKISISAYNSKTNRVVERGHFTIREVLVKACQDKISQWPDYVPYAFFADKVTVRRQTGFMPFYLLYGTNPVLPFDLAEATFMVESFQAGMSSEDLLAARIQQLQKRPEDMEKAAAVLKENRFKSKEQFEHCFRTKMRHQPLSDGSLVLVCNTGVEQDLDRKHKSRYLGPYQIYRRTKGGSYVLKELDGIIMRRGVTAFRLLPYISRNDSILEDMARDGSLDAEASEKEEKNKDSDSSDED